jgi:hypothetical protein
MISFIEISLLHSNLCNFIKSITCHSLALSKIEHLLIRQDSVILVPVLLQRFTLVIMRFNMLFV